MSPTNITQSTLPQCNRLMLSLQLRKGTHHPATIVGWMIEGLDGLEQVAHVCLAGTVTTLQKSTSSGQVLLIQEFKNRTVMFSVSKLHSGIREMSYGEGIQIMIFLNLHLHLSTWMFSHFIPIIMRLLKTEKRTHDIVFSSTMPVATETTWLVHDYWQSNAIAQQKIKQSTLLFKSFPMTCNSAA